MLDRAFRNAFRSFSTLFFVVAIVTLPLHLVYGLVFQDVIATRDIHEQISEFPKYRQVRNVGPTDVTTARYSYWAVSVLELALVPLAVRATRRVIDVERTGGVATAPAAWRNAIRRGNDDRSFHSRSLPPVAVAAIAAFVLGFLLERIGLLVVDLIPDDVAWVGLGVVQGVARAVAAPFALSAFVSGTIAAKEAPLVTPKLY
ncbi:MAG: hypothetical protein ACRDKT_17415 [Actinomycetota bacterium]